jgi:hypothetical protein
MKLKCLPVMFTTYLTKPLSKKVSLVGGVGLGVVLPSDGVADLNSTAVYSYSATTYYETGKATITFNKALGYRGVFGAEYKLSPKVSLFGAFNFLATSLSTNTSVMTDTSWQTNGYTTVYTTNTTYVDSLPTNNVHTSTSTTVDNRVNGTGTVVVSTTNYNSTLVETTTYNNYTIMGRTYVLNNQTVKVSSPFNQLSFIMGLTVRF